MIKRLLAIVLAAVLLCGCQLAEPESEGSGQDRLVGVFVTRDSLNLFDMESYLQDNAGKLTNGGELFVEDSAEYSRRIYATLVPEEYTADDGSKHNTLRYEFLDLEGELLTCYLVNGGILVEPDGTNLAYESYWSSDGGNWFSDIQTGIRSNQYDNTSINLEATIYVSREMEEILFFYNPVYQTASGEVYLVEGYGNSCQFYEGSSMTHTLNEERESTISGDENTYRTDIEITVKCIAMAQRIVVNYVDGNNQVFSWEEYAGEEIPLELHAPEGTEYLVCEVYRLNDEGEETMFRQIRDRESDPIELYREIEDGICRKTKLNVIWPEESE